MYAYVINHFGDNIKYLEYEIYFLINLRKFTKFDIIYLYSFNDTPQYFLDILKQFNLDLKFIGYNDIDLKLSKNQKNNFIYKDFNALRTCNIIHVNLLTQYDKICILESDMFIIKSIDDIFELNTSSCLFLKDKKKDILMVPQLNEKKVDKQIDSLHLKINLDIDEILSFCSKGSPINGGLMLVKTSLEKYENFKKNIKNVILDNKCSYPNEILFLINNPICYSLPVKYNLIHDYLKKKLIKHYKHYDDIRLIHFNNTSYKPIDIIKTNYIDKLQTNEYKFIINLYKKFIYDPYTNKINKILLEYK